MRGGHPDFEGGDDRIIPLPYRPLLFRRFGKKFVNKSADEAGFCCGIWSRSDRHRFADVVFCGSSVGHVASATNGHDDQRTKAYAFPFPSSAVSESCETQGRLVGVVSEPQKRCAHVPN